MKQDPEYATPEEVATRLNERTPEPKMSLHDIYEEAQKLTNPEEDLNRILFRFIQAGSLTEETFLEYLEVTQGDIVDTMTCALFPEESESENS